MQPRFHIGDIVTAIPGAPYVRTVAPYRMRVFHIESDGIMQVRMEDRRSSQNGYYYPVEARYFTLIEAREKPPKKQVKENKETHVSALEQLSDAARKELQESIKYMKTCPYKVTAIKVELEAQLNRGADEDSQCDYCDDGSHYNSDTDEYETCEGCNGSGYTESEWGDGRCQEFILSHVPKEAKDALKFSKFYWDGSVDSEFTFTLPIDKAEMTVYFVEAFKALSQEIGGGLDTGGAGMHMAILNDKDGKYGGWDNNEIDGRYALNFKKAMEPLLPALFFLASPDNKSRGLGYRGPGNLCSEGKGTAIACNHNVFEYRVFETCYQRPLAILDNIIVIAKTLQFYKNEPTDTSAKLGQIGFKDGSGLDRFYFTTTHIQALKHGLKYLKPEYTTLAQLEAQRGVKVSEKALLEKEEKLMQQWASEFKGVKERRQWERKVMYHRELARNYERRYPTSEAVQRTKLYVKENTQHLKGNAKKYVADKLKQYKTEDVRYTITV